jgi:hypothetical protein
MGSTIAEAGLNFRVRNGNGCDPRSMDGGKTVASTSVPVTTSLEDQLLFDVVWVDDLNHSNHSRSMIDL